MVIDVSRTFRRRRRTDLIALLAAEIVTIALVVWAHQIPTIGGRVPIVFVASWFGATTLVALVFTMHDASTDQDRSSPTNARRRIWGSKVRLAMCALVPLMLTPLLERRGVQGDWAIWLLDCAPIIALMTTPYFTLVARTAFGGAVLSVGAFQALWICGAAACFRIMERSIQAAGGHIGPGAAFEEFFRRPEYRYLFFVLCAAMLLGYCPAIWWLGRRRFLATASVDAAAPASEERSVR